MDHRNRESIYEMKKSLEKCLAAKDNIDNHIEPITDILAVLEHEQLTAQLIKDLKLGKIVNQVKERYEKIAGDLSNRAKLLLLRWKKIIEESTHAHGGTSISSTSGGNGVKTDRSQSQSLTQSQDSKTSDHHGSKARREDDHKPKAASVKLDNNIQPVQFVKSTTNNNDGSSNKRVMSSKQREVVDSLIALRRSIFQLFHDSFHQTCHDEHRSATLAIDIEEALHQQSIQNNSSNTYSSKAKSLLFNLKKNGPLRSSVVNGSITCSDLVNLSASELASHEQKVTREKLKAEAFEGRRLDWMEENKALIRLDNNIDPNSEWLYDDDNDSKSEPDFDPPDI